MRRYPYPSDIGVLLAPKVTDTEDNLLVPALFHFGDEVGHGVPFAGDFVLAPGYFYSLPGFQFRCSGCSHAGNSAR